MHMFNCSNNLILKGNNSSVASNRKRSYEEVSSAQVFTDAETTRIQACRERRRRRMSILASKRQKKPVVTHSESSKPIIFKHAVNHVATSLPQWNSQCSISSVAVSAVDPALKQCDPKLYRKLKNRESAARSRQKTVDYIDQLQAELERKQKKYRDLRAIHSQCSLKPMSPNSGDALTVSSLSSDTNSYYSNTSNSSGDCHDELLLPCYTSPLTNLFEEGCFQMKSSYHGCVSQSASHVHWNIASSSNLLGDLFTPSTVSSPVSSVPAAMYNQQQFYQDQSSLIAYPSIGSFSLFAPASVPFQGSNYVSVEPTSSVNYEEVFSFDDHGSRLGDDACSNGYNRYGDNKSNNSYNYSVDSTTSYEDEGLLYSLYEDHSLPGLDDCMEQLINSC